MPKLRVHNLAISIDGYGAGPDQSLDNPLGVGGERLHDWAVATHSFKRIHGEGDDAAGGTGLVDEMHVPIVPILLGRGERLFDNLDGAMDGYECVELVCSPAVAHARFARKGA